jgi:hypothetical protein
MSANCCPIKESSGCLSGIFETTSGSSRNDPVACRKEGKLRCLNWSAAQEATTSFVVLQHKGRFVPALELFAAALDSAGPMNHPVFIVDRGVHGRLVVDLSLVDEAITAANIIATSQTVAPALSVLLGASAATTGAHTGAAAVVRAGLRVTMTNRSECPAYLYSGKATTIEGVSHSVGVRPRETVTLFLDAVNHCWQVQAHSN